MGIQERMHPFPTVVGLGAQNDIFLWVAVPEDGEGSTADVKLHCAVKASSESYHTAARWARVRV